MIKVSPSLLAANFANLEKDIKEIENYVDYFHIDIMDGNFVPNISFGLDITKTIANITNKPLDIHLMINEPLKYIAFIRADQKLLLSIAVGILPCVFSLTQPLIVLTALSKFTLFASAL